MLRVTVWNENIHEKEMPEVRAIYPEGIHGALAAYLNTLEGVEAARQPWISRTAACRRGAEQHRCAALVGALRPSSCAG